MRVVAFIEAEQSIRSIVGHLGLWLAMLRHGPVILKLCKLAVNKSLDVPWSIGMYDERDLLAMSLGTEDQREVLKPFLEKQKPQ